MKPHRMSVDQILEQMKRNRYTLDKLEEHIVLRARMQEVIEVQRNELVTLAATLVEHMSQLQEGEVISHEFITWRDTTIASIRPYLTGEHSAVGYLSKEAL